MKNRNYILQIRLARYGIFFGPSVRYLMNILMSSINTKEHEHLACLYYRR